MGIFGALTNAVTGLRAQAYALENISGNIANAQTTAFKRMDTSFQDLIPDMGGSKQLAGSVFASGRTTNSVQGDIASASTSTFMAINGDGFFVVQKPVSFSDGNPVFETTNLYSRRGDFSTNKDGYLVNGAGYYLMGVPVDPSTGNPTGSVPQTLRFQNDALPAIATTRIEYRANLPLQPKTQDYSAATPNSELLQPSAFTADPRIAGTGTVIGNDVPVFLRESISGGAVTVYDEAGSPVNVQLRWAKTDSVQAGGTDRWELFYQADANATGANVAWKNAGTSYAFGADGKLNPAIPSLSLTNVTVDGKSLGDVALSHGSSGVTQFADVNGTVAVNQLDQNGYSSGALDSVAVNDKGRIIGTYSNGRTIDLAAISVASFNGPDFLNRIDGGAFEATDASGPALYGNGGAIVGSALEASNTDIADEFTKLIVTQQAYSANTKIVTTSNEMVQDLLNMLR